MTEPRNCCNQKIHSPGSHASSEGFEKAHLPLKQLNSYQLNVMSNPCKHRLQPSQNLPQAYDSGLLAKAETGLRRSLPAVGVLSKFGADPASTEPSLRMTSKASSAPILNAQYGLAAVVNSRSFNCVCTSAGSPSFSRRLLKVSAQSIASTAEQHRKSNTKQDDPRSSSDYCHTMRQRHVIQTQTRPTRTLNQVPSKHKARCHASTKPGAAQETAPHEPRLPVVFIKTQMTNTYC